MLRPGDSTCYVVERTAPWRVVRVVSAAEDGPVSPALLGLPAAFVVSVLEPEQRTLQGIALRALAKVRPGFPAVFRYRSARFSNSSRCVEVVDRDPADPYLYVYCRDGALGPYNPGDDRDQRARNE